MPTADDTIKGPNRPRKRPSCSLNNSQTCDCDQILLRRWRANIVAPVQQAPSPKKRRKPRGQSRLKTKSIKEYFQSIDISVDFYEHAIKPTTVKDASTQTNRSFPTTDLYNSIDLDQLTSEKASPEYWEVLARKRYEELCQLTEENNKLESIIEEMAEDMIRMQTIDHCTVGLCDNMS